MYYEINQWVSAPKTEFLSWLSFISGESFYVHHIVTINLTSWFPILQVGEVHEIGLKHAVYSQW